MSPAQRQAPLTQLSPPLQLTHCAPLVPQALLLTMPTQTCRSQHVLQFDGPQGSRQVCPTHAVCPKQMEHYPRPQALFSVPGRHTPCESQQPVGQLASAPTWLPGGDVFLGVTTAIGSGPRVHLALDLGLWTLFLPAGRVVVALNVADRLFVSLAGVLAFHPYVPSQTLDASLRFVGNLALGIGVGF